MTDYLTDIPILDRLSQLVKWLLLFNVLLTGGVILLAWRAALYKERVDELEAERDRSVSDAMISPLTDDRPIPPIRRRSTSRS